MSTSECSSALRSAWSSCARSLSTPAPAGKLNGVASHSSGAAIRRSYGSEGHRPCLLLVSEEPAVVDEWIRIGEAKNPGPYTYGGASSSGGVGAGAAQASVRHDESSSVDGRGVSSAAQLWISGLDDPEGACWEDEELDTPLPQPFHAVGPTGIIPEEGVHAALFAHNAADHSSMQHFEADLRQYLPEGTQRRPSAMCLWEVCPALLEGAVELPTIEEDNAHPGFHTFHTAEGWAVRDNWKFTSLAEASARAHRLGIEGRFGEGSRAGSRPLEAVLPSVQPEAKVHEKLARFLLADLPQLPDVEELLDSPQNRIVEDISPSLPRAAGEVPSSTVKPRTRKRGKRQRGGGRSRDSEESVSLWSFNSSGAPQLKAAVGLAAQLGSKSPVAILNQEHHACAEHIPDLQAQLKKSGWKCAPVRAVQTHLGGRSAGVAVLTPSHVAAGVDSKLALDLSPSGSEGRLAALWVQQVAPGGILALSLYLHDGEQGSVRNVELLFAALKAAQASGCPWVLGMDGQQSPEELLKWAAPMLENAGAIVANTGGPTHFPGVGCCRCLDYFIVSRSLADAIIAVDTISELRYLSGGDEITVSAKPHYVVQIKLRKKFQPMLLSSLKAPRAFPRQKPIGCARRPAAVEEWDEVAKCREDDNRDSVKNAISNQWAAIVTAIEEELCGVCDFVGQQHRGRANGISVAQRPALPRRAAGSLGQMRQTEYAVVWGANRLRELLVLSEKHASFRSLTPGQWQQWECLVRKVCSPSAPVCCTDQRWEHVTAVLQAHRANPREACNALRIASNWAAALVNRQSKARALRRYASWQEWKRQLSRAGGPGGALFAFLKRTEQDPELVVRCGSFRSASPQAVLHQDFQVWNTLWQKLSCHGATPWRTERLEVDSSSPLPPLRHGALRAAARTFKTSTGAGADGLLPSQLGWLSDALLDQLGQLLVRCEEVSCWPSQTALSLIHLIPKATGGRRPIGVLNALIRLWERARKETTDQWRRTCTRNYDWMSPGRGAERSVWAQTLYEEAAAAKGLATASIFLDLVKAFEQVILAQVWKKGCAHGMPVEVLALSLEACAFTRRLTYRGAVSEPAETCTAILAGSGRATDLLLLALIDSIDNIMIEHESSAIQATLRCFTIVDDIRFAVEGEEEVVARYLPKLAERAVCTLEEDLCMCVSRDSGQVQGKTVAQASSSKLGARIKPRLARLGIRVVSKVKNLGVHFVAGGKRGYANPVSAQRFRAALRKVDRAKALGRFARRKAISSVLLPSFTFGAIAITCPRGLVRQLRVHSAKAIGPVAGRSTSARLLLEGMDVGEMLAIKTIMAWVNGLWDQLVEPSIMQRAWQYACAHNLWNDRQSRGSVAGAAAYLEHVEKLGWTTPSFDSVRTRQGIILFFGNGPPPKGTYAAAPTLVKKFIKDEYEQHIMLMSTVGKDLADLSGLRGYPWDEQQALAAVAATEAPTCDQQGSLSSLTSAADERRRAAMLWRRGRYEHHDDAPVPWLWPIRVAMSAAKRAGLPAAAASLRALAEGGWITQFRLRCQRQAEHAVCLCKQAVGTLKHKLSQCSLSDELRQQHCPEWLLLNCKREPWNPLFSRGVPARPKAAPLPSDLEWREMHPSVQECVAAGDIYTDGSAVGTFWRARRGGWASVSVDDCGRWRWTKFGTVGGPNVSSHRAELRAVAETLKVAQPPLHIHTDNQAVVDGVRQGRDSCVHSKAVDADLWRSVWDLLDTARKKGDVQVSKVKAHTGWLDLLLRRIDPKSQYGNLLADLAAKEAAARSEKQAPAVSFRAQTRQALAWSRWIIRYAANWIADTEAAAAPVHVAKVECERPAPFDFGESHLKHELWQIGGEVICRRCALRRAQAVETKFTAERCTGAAAGRAAAQASGNINFVWSRFTSTRAELASRGGRRITQGAPPKWMVDPGGLREASSSHLHLQELRDYLNGAGADEQCPPWLGPPSWMPSYLVQPWEVGGAALRREVGCNREALATRSSAHSIAFNGAIAFCTRCACFSERRVGSRFKGACVIPEGRAAAAVGYRLRRLREGRHPITGLLLGT